MASKPSKGKNSKPKTTAAPKKTNKKSEDLSKKPDKKSGESVVAKTSKTKKTQEVMEESQPVTRVDFHREGLLENYPDVKIIIAALICFLLMLCNFHMCGTLGNYLYLLMHGLFGFMAYVLPVFILVSYAFLLSNSGKYYSAAQSKVLFAVLIFWNVTGFAHLLGGTKDVPFSPATYFKMGQTDFNGGLFGGILAGSIQKVIGSFGAWVFLIAMFLILVIFITERKATMAIADQIKSTKTWFAGGEQDGQEELPPAEKDKDGDQPAYEELTYEEVTERGSDYGTPGPDHVLNVPDDYPGRKTAGSRGKFLNGKLPFGKDKNEPVRQAVKAEVREEDTPFRYPEKGPVTEKKAISNGMNGNKMRAQKMVIDREIATLESMGFHQASFLSLSQLEERNASVSIDDFILYNGLQEWDDSMPYVMPELQQPVSEPVEEEDSYYYRPEMVESEDIFDKESVLVSADNWQSDRSGEIIGADTWQSDTDAEDDFWNVMPEVFEGDGFEEDEDAFVFPVEDAVDLTEHVELPDSFAAEVPKKGKSVQDINIWKDKDSKGSRSDSGSVTFSEPVKKVEKPALIKKPYVAPPINKLKAQGVFKLSIGNSHREIQQKLAHTLESFGVKVKMGAISVGPAVTRYELEPEVGVKVSRIVSLQDDIKLALAAADVRIEAPIPGKSAVGIEVPNKENTIVGFRELIDTDKFKNHPSKLCVAIGRDLAGQVQVADLAKMPHLLIAGATGSGKSVCINTLIMSILYKAKPDEVKLIMVDPKVVELSAYNGIPHLLIPVVTDPRKASNALRWAVDEMDSRYNKLAQYKVRNIQGYNEEIKKRKELDPGLEDEPMYQMVIIVDELADLMMVAPGEVEEAICRLAQKARAAGIHLVLATQRPSVNVITGLIKANVPSRIAFAVSSGVDSRTILDMNGAEKLLGKGDMLYYPYGLQKPIRVQGAFISDEEVSDVVEYIVKHNSDKSGEEQMEEMITSASETKQISTDQDEYFAEAARFIIEKDKASIGALQRQFKIGFNRAARLMDALADVGIVGEEEGTKPRKILMNLEELEAFLKNM